MQAQVLRRNDDAINMQKKVPAEVLDKHTLYTSTNLSITNLSKHHYKYFSRSKAHLINHLSLSSLFLFSLFLSSPSIHSSHLPTSSPHTIPLPKMPSTPPHPPPPPQPKPKPKTTTTLHTTPSLALRPPLLQHLTNLINTSFSTSHAHLIPRSQKRLDTPNQILSELGENGFMLLTYTHNAQRPPPTKNDEGVDGDDGDGGDEGDGLEGGGEGEGELIACAGMKPWYSKAPHVATHNIESDLSQLHEPHEEIADANDIIKQAKSSNPPPNPNPHHTDDTLPPNLITEWEVTLVVVSQKPQYTHRGLASSLLSQLDREILAKVRERPIRIVARTLKEIHEGYWVRRGFRTVREERMPVGSWNSYVEFGLVEMERWLR